MIDQETNQRNVNMKRVISLFMFCMFAGCFTVEREGGKFLNKEEISRRSVISDCKKAEITAIRPVIVRQGDNYVLHLEADGSFVYDAERIVSKKVSGRKRVVSIGFFPGLVVPETQAQRENPVLRKSKTWIFFGVFFGNVGLVGIPTVCSLLIEPFREHYLRFAGSEFTDLGLVGCRKYLVDVSPHIESERETESVKWDSVTLKGYEVTLDGKPFRSDNGEIRFSGLPSGTSLRIRITTPPTSIGSSSDEAQSLVGLELISVCP